MNALRAGNTALTVASIVAILGDSKQTNVIEARQVKSFVEALRGDPEHGVILSGSKQKPGTLHPVVAALVSVGYQESSAKQYLSKMRAIRTAYVNTGYVPKDGQTWNGA